MNVALGHVPTVTSTQVSSGATTYRAANATDGDKSTRWSSVCGNPASVPGVAAHCDVPGFAPRQETLAVDLGTSQPVRRVVLDWEHAYASKYAIEVSDDGKNWTRPIATQSDATFLDTPAGPVDTISLSVQTRWIRVVCLRRAQDNLKPKEKPLYGFSLYEFGVFK